MKKIVLLLAVLLSLGAHAQSVYRWVDKDGKVQYSDVPPPPDVKNVQQKKLGSGVTIDQENVPYGVKLAMEKNPVVLYANACGEPCSGARALLAKRGIVYASKDPEKNPADTEALQKIAGALDVPVLTIGEKLMRGFDEGNWNSALDAAGYPRTNPFSADAKKPDAKAPADAKAPTK
jgi:glutaredoxin